MLHINAMFLHPGIYQGRLFAVGFKAANLGTHVQKEQRFKALNQGSFSFWA